MVMKGQQMSLLWGAYFHQPLDSPSNSISHDLMGSQQDWQCLLESNSESDSSADRLQCRWTMRENYELSQGFAIYHDISIAFLFCFSCFSFLASPPPLLPSHSLISFPFSPEDVQSLTPKAAATHCAWSIGGNGSLRPLPDPAASH